MHSPHNPTCSYDHYTSTNEQPYVPHHTRFRCSPCMLLDIVALFSSGHSPLHIDKHAMGLTIAYLRSAIRMHVCRSRKRENQTLSDNSAVLLYLRPSLIASFSCPPKTITTVMCLRCIVHAQAAGIMWQLLHGRKCNEC